MQNAQNQIFRTLYLYLSSEKDFLLFKTHISWLLVATVTVAAL